MHSALRADDVRKERLHLAGSEIRERAARPRVFVPALRDPALEVLGETGKDLLQLRKRELDPVCLRHPGHAPTVHPGGQGLEDSPRTWLTYRVFEHPLDRKVSGRRNPGAFAGPGLSPELQVDSRARRVRELAAGLCFARR